MIGRTNFHAMWSAHESGLPTLRSRPQLVRGRGRSMARWGSIKRACKVCGKQFRITPAGAARGYGKYCGRLCLAIGKQRNREARVAAARAATFAKCSRCHEVSPITEFMRRSAGNLGRSSHCKVCDARRNAAIRARPEVRARHAAQQRQRLLDPAERTRSNARRATRRAIETGRLVRQPCEVCGAAKTEAHHDDYTRLFDVQWLCRLHHAQHHLAAGRAELVKEAGKNG